jgi:hypothetical protein
MKYKVSVGWYNSQKWEVEADSEAEAIDKATEGDGILIWEDWDIENTEILNDD